MLDKTRKLVICLILIGCIISMECRIPPVLPVQPEKFTSPEHLQDFINRLKEVSYFWGITF